MGDPPGFEREGVDPSGFDTPGFDPPGFEREGVRGNVKIENLEASGSGTGCCDIQSDNGKCSFLFSSCVFS